MSRTEEQTFLTRKFCSFKYFTSTNRVGSKIKWVTVYRSSEPATQKAGVHETLQQNDVIMKELSGTSKSWRIDLSELWAFTKSEGWPLRSCMSFDCRRQEKIVSNVMRMKWNVYEKCDQKIYSSFCHQIKQEFTKQPTTRHRTCSTRRCISVINYLIYVMSLCFYHFANYYIRISPCGYVC